MDRPLGSQLSEANVNQRALSQLQQQYPAFARQRVTITPATVAATCMPSANGLMSYEMEPYGPHLQRHF